MKQGFGERIRSEMNEQGWTENLLPEELGSKRSLNNWLNERAEPKFEALQVISKLLSVNLHWVLTGDGPKDLPAPTGSESARQAREQFYREMREVNERRIARMDLEKRAAKLASEIKRFNSAAPTDEQISQEVKS